MKNRWLFLLVAVPLLAAGLAGSARADGDTSVTFTALVVPARHSVLQVAFDLLPRRPVVLLSYQLVRDYGDAPVLHAWDGKRWVWVSATDYADANFVQVIPNRVILVGPEGLLPASLVRASAWAPKVVTMPTLDTTELLNEFATLFDFTPLEWEWFAKRYNRQLEDLHAEHRGSWYEQSREEFLRKEQERKARQAAGEATANGAWTPVERAAPVANGSDELPPVLVNEVPPAVIVPAGDLP